jgi:hypothetical protein
MFPSPCTSPMSLSITPLNFTQSAFLTLGSVFLLSFFPCYIRLLHSILMGTWSAGSSWSTLHPNSYIWLELTMVRPGALTRSPCLLEYLVA